MTAKDSGRCGVELAWDTLGVLEMAEPEKWSCCGTLWSPEDHEFQKSDTDSTQSTLGLL